MSVGTSVGLLQYVPTVQYHTVVYVHKYHIYAIQIFRAHTRLQYIHTVYMGSRELVTRTRAPQFLASCCAVGEGDRDDTCCCSLPHHLPPVALRNVELKSCAREKGSVLQKRSMDHPLNAHPVDDEGLWDGAFFHVVVLFFGNM